MFDLQTNDTIRVRGLDYRLSVGSISHNSLINYGKQRLKWVVIPWLLSWQILTPNGFSPCNKKPHYIYPCFYRITQIRSFAHVSTPMGNFLDTMGAQRQCKLCYIYTTFPLLSVASVWSSMKGNVGSRLEAVPFLFVLFEIIFSYFTSTRVLLSTALHEILTHDLGISVEHLDRFWCKSLLYSFIKHLFFSSIVVPNNEYITEVKKSSFLSI